MFDNVFLIATNANRKDIKEAAHPHSAICPFYMSSQSPIQVSITSSNNFTPSQKPHIARLLNLLTMSNPQDLHPAIRQPPTCRKCGIVATMSRCSSSNTNGNADRPYYQCQCGQFICFGDMRGVLPGFPPCRCGQTVRRILVNTKVDGVKRRKIQLQCATMTCNFRQDVHNADGSLALYDGPVERDLLISMGL